MNTYGRILPDPDVKRTGWPWEIECSNFGARMQNGAEWPKISIVTPSLNQGQYIEETIRSVICQGYPNLEYIVFDGGSNDGTVELLKKYGSWIDFWVSEPDSGQSDAINKGLARCTGEIFNWICSDDYLEKDSLFYVAEAIIQAQADVFLGQARLLLIDGSTCLASTPVSDRLERMIYLAQICQPATFFSRKIAQSLGSLNPFLHFCMDAEWWMKYLIGNGRRRIVTSDIVVSNYRFHEDSKTVSLSQRFADEFRLLRAALLPHLSTSRILRRYYTSYYTSHLEVKCLEGINQFSPEIVKSRLLMNYSMHAAAQSFRDQQVGSFIFATTLTLYYLGVSLLFPIFGALGKSNNRKAF